MINRKQKPYKYDRMASEIERVITEVISYEVSDKRVMGNCEVTGIILSKDYSHCKVFVDIKIDDKKEVIDGLKNASGFIKHIVTDQLDLRKVPELSFIIDETKQRVDRINELLEQIKSN